MITVKPDYEDSGDVLLLIDQIQSLRILFWLRKWTITHFENIMFYGFYAFQWIFSRIELSIK